MITLSPEQRRELDLAGLVQVLDPQTQKTYALVPAELYQRLLPLLTGDDAPSKREVALLVERALREYDANDPTLKLYQQDEGTKRRS